jgi:opacity protein-like surface antigen
MRTIAILCVSFAALCSSAQAADGKLSVNLGLDYSSGHYGGQTRTETWALPVSLKYRTDAWSLRVSTAWLRVQGAGNVTPDGDPLNTSGSVSTTEGMGDVTASLSYNLIDERSHWAGLDVGGKIKFGTADETQSLGTGEDDYTLHAELFKPLSGWTPFLRLGYKWKGDPASIEYRDVWLGSLGTDIRISPTLSFGGSYDWQQAVTQTSSPTREAMLYLNFRLGTASKLNVYAVGGFSDASPDWGSGFILTHTY